MFTVNIWREFRYLLLAALLMYGVAAIAGAAVGSFEPMEKSAAEIPRDPLYYIGHNSRASLLFVSGLLTIGMSSIFALFANGFMIGFSVASKMQETAFAATMMHVVPHGIFEVPAMILAGAVGLYPLQLIIRYARGIKPVRIAWVQLAQSVVLIAALIAAAGVVEAWITPHIIESILSVGG
ncbi:stage II sporulation protein M [Paenibacillus thailandensis]|uniref:Stage II sporulation protein M n=1 Tax=Paenibacillus thailandensis TaxID=393250 RepID=A0ABW5R1K7_9BACL